MGYWGRVFGLVNKEMCCLDLLISVACSLLKGLFWFAFYLSC